MKNNPHSVFWFFLSCPRYINHKLKKFFNYATRCNKCKLTDKINQKTSKTPTNQKTQTYIWFYCKNTVHILQKYSPGNSLYPFLDPTIHSVLFCLKVMIFHTFSSLSYSEIQLGLTFHFSDKEECKWFFNGIFSDYAR